MLRGRLNRTKIDWQMWLLGQRLFALWPVSYSLLSGQLCTYLHVLMVAEIGLRLPAGEPCLIEPGAIML